MRVDATEDGTAAFISPQEFTRAVGMNARLVWRDIRQGLMSALKLRGHRRWLIPRAYLRELEAEAYAG
jgi:hypothetical protein